MRHGTAERRGPSGGDFDRPLTAQGRAEALAIAHALAEAGHKPDFAVVSSATRASQTWEEAARVFGDVEAVFDKAMYSAHPQGVLDQAQAHRGCVMVVGHNPTLHDLAVGLLHEGGAPRALAAKVEMKFPPATAVAFSFDAEGLPVFDGLFYAAEAMV